MLIRSVRDARRHLGVLPPYGFYGGRAVAPDVRARPTVAALRADLDAEGDAEGTERTVVVPNYGVPDACVSFAFNELCIEAAQADERVLGGLWVSPRPADRHLADAALAAGRFFDWVAAGKRVYTDSSWAIGFAPRCMAAAGLRARPVPVRQ